MRKKYSLLLIILCIFLSGCQSKKVSNEENSVDKIQLIKYGYTMKQVEAQAEITKGDDIEKLLSILKSSTVDEGQFTDLMGVVFYKIVIDKNDTNGDNKKETYTVYQLSKDFYTFIKSDGETKYKYVDKNMELSGLLEKYLKCKNPFETN